MLIGGSNRDVLLRGWADKEEDLQAIDAALATWRADDVTSVLDEFITAHDENENDDLTGGLADDELFGRLRSR